MPFVIFILPIKYIFREVNDDAHRKDVGILTSRAWGKATIFRPAERLPAISGPPWLPVFLNPSQSNRVKPSKNPFYLRNPLIISYLYIIQDKYGPSESRPVKPSQTGFT